MNPNQKQQILLNQQQAARFLGLSPRTLEAWRLSGKPPRFLKLGAAVRYRMEDLEKWLDERCRKSTSDDGSHHTSERQGGRR